MKWIAVSNITETRPHNIPIYKKKKKKKKKKKMVVKTKIFTEKKKKKDIFLIFAQNIDCGYTFERPRRFGAKIRKIGIPLHTPVLLYKSGV